MTKAHRRHQCSVHRDHQCSVHRRHQCSVHRHHQWCTQVQPVKLNILVCAGILRDTGSLRGDWTSDNHHWYMKGHNNPLPVVGTQVVYLCSI